MIDRLRKIKSLIIEALKEAESMQSHDDQWRRYVGHLADAKVATWRAMDQVPPREQASGVPELN
jgi:hypothetical protein